MTISSTTRQAGPYAGNDVTTVFPFAFKVFAAADLLVAETDDEGAQTVLVLTTDYSVSLNADQNVSPGGTITRVGALPTGYALLITSALGALQPTNLTNAGGFYPRVINDALDRVTILLQQTQGEATRALKLPYGEVAASLPNAASRALKVLGFDANGDPAVGAAVDFSLGALVDLSNVNATTGRNALDVYSKAETRALIPQVPVAWFYAGGVVPYVDPTTQTYAARALAPDITTAFQAAIDFAEGLVAAGSSTVDVVLPAGMLNYSASITWTNGICVRGVNQGTSSAATWLRWAGAGTGVNTLQIGASGSASVLGAGLYNVLIFRDHGAAGFGYTNPVAASFLNKMTGGAMVVMNNGYFCTIQNIEIYGGYEGIVMQGGKGNLIENVGCFGIWDLTNAARQESYCGYRQSLGTSGPPTYIQTKNLRLEGDWIAGYNATYPGPNNMVTQYNIGWQYGAIIECGEQCEFDVYVQRCAKSGVRIKSLGGRVNQGYLFTGSIDTCGITTADAGLLFTADDAAGVTKNVTLANDFQGQANGLIAISDAGTAATVSVVGLQILGNISDWVGCAVSLTKACVVSSTANNYNFNCQGWYNNAAGAGYYIASTAKGIDIDGVIGGTNAGTPAGHFCRVGVWADNAQTSKISVGATDNGCLVGLFSANGTVQPYDQSIAVRAIAVDANFSAVWGIDGPMIISGVAVTATRTLTLTTTDYLTRAIPDGTVWNFNNLLGGPGGWLVKNGAGTTLATCATAGTGGRFVFYSTDWRLQP